MSTVAEIEAAIEHLPAKELRRLQERIFSHATLPKTGAELAKLWPGRFHLRPAEADAFAVEISGDRILPPQHYAWE